MSEGPPMDAHEEQQRLSAYLDGELSPAENASLEAHLSSCDSCREVLHALQSTVEDLRGLETPELDELDSHRLRAAIATERRTASRARWMRWASAAAAAAVVGIVFFTAHGAVNRPLAESAKQASNDFASTQFTKDTAQARLRELAAGFGDGSLQAPTAGGVAGTGSTTNPTAAEQPVLGATPDVLSTPADSNSRSFNPAQLSKCAATVTSSTKDKLEQIDAIAGEFEEKAAFLLFFATPPGHPARVELWVLSQTDCSVLYFAQAKAGS